MNEDLKIPHTAALIASCWDEAERALQDEIRENCPGIDEEHITQTFHAKLAASLQAASKDKKIEAAFKEDLAASPLLDIHSPVQFDPRQLARNLEAYVVLHKRKTEEKTAGDLGIVLIRPNVRLLFSNLRVSSLRRGLLTQAKLKGPRGWNKFTRNQKTILPERLSYFALLLYKYNDESYRELNPFTWVLGRGASLDQLERMLQENNLDGLKSNDIIKSLASARIGTSDKTTIDDIIAPSFNSSLTIVIDWPPDKSPSSHVRVTSRHQTRSERVLLRH